MSPAPPCEVTPRIGADPRQLNVTKRKQELAQEPVDSVDVISPSPHPPPERRILDHRPSRLPGIEFGRDAANQIIDLPRVVTRTVQVGRPEQRISNLIAGHPGRITAGLGHGRKPCSS